MIDLTDVKFVKAILAQHGLRPQKRLGQHFLIDKRVLERLLTTAEVSLTDTVVEVGAGIGVITIELAKKAKKVYAIEIDKNLIPILKTNINDFKNVNVIQRDILEFNPTTYHLPLITYKLIGAIPYQITSPLLHHLLIQECQPLLIAIIIQKEVAEKITACPPKATYLSNFVGVFGKAEIIGKPISPSSFWPQPDVYSTILKITMKQFNNETIERLSKKMVKKKRIAEFQSFLHCGFSRPRKMLNKAFDEKLLTAAGIAPTRRAQTLTQEEWLKLFELFVKKHTI